MTKDLAMTGHLAWVAGVEEHELWVAGLYLSAPLTQPPGSFQLPDRLAKDSCCQTTGGSGGIHSRELGRGVAHTFWGT